ncbi:UNVERIFIED_CONTAM: hypothetical protein PYX00_003189 [Menopon gallinae]|uniref:Nucleoporin NUP42 n=1 Tax=Menopon gallinae TaxID=328185 RepID=A0AAW2I0H2_9NEOP
MVVCQYFLQGRCSFGVNCKNEHIYNNNSGGRGGRNAGNNQINNIVWQISNEVITAEKGGQWPLSCFAPLKEGPCLPGWEDISPEEVRWTLYEAQKNGSVNQALNQINQWYKNAEKSRNLLKQPTQEVINLLYDMKGKKAQSTTATSGSFATSTPDPKSSFRFDTAVNNMYGKGASPGQGSIFGGGNNVFQSTSIFGGQSAMPSGGLFSKPQESNQNAFSTAAANPFANSGTSVFQNSNVNRNIFQSQPASNVFQTGAPVFSGGFAENSNIFGGNQTAQFQPQNQAQIFGGGPNKQTTSTPPVKEVDASVYSKMEDLNENEIKAFTSTTFTFGNIPLKPPPEQYC